MIHFKGLEGLRGWLATTVVIDHLFAFHQFYFKDHRLLIIQDAADFAVQIFIIISGFVITHLIVEKGEDFVPYIVRRCLRIYPVYLACLVLGVISTWLWFDAMLPVPWGDATFPTSHLLAQAQSLRGDGWLVHLLLHISLLHGLVGSNLLYDAQYMYLSPAWSLSLEWQFYLVAPFLIASAKSSSFARRASIGALCLLAYLLYRRGFLGAFALPSALPGAVLYFATGIGTRLAIPYLPSIKSFPLATIFLLLIFVLTAKWLFPFWFWILFMAWMLADVFGQPRASARICSALNAIFDSSAARWLGAHSFAIYLVHLPLLQILIWLTIKLGHLDRWQSFAACLVVLPAVTLAAAMLLHKYIELPSIRFGRSLFVRTAHP